MTKFFESLKVFSDSSQKEGEKTATSGRLLSLDCLRGFDIFVLIAFQPILMALIGKINHPCVNFIKDQLQHRDWSGFSFWDLIMPLFMFISGITIPLALEKHRQEGFGQIRLWSRMLRRVVLLWLLGMIVQGNLLAFSFDRIYFYSNTLQAIAMGCLIAFIAVLYLPKTYHLVIVTAILLLSYWGLLQFVTIEGFGGGNYTAQGNLAEYVDQIILGRFRDGARLNAAGQVQFASYYHYTWILTSLAFGAMVLFGSIAGKILSKENQKMPLFKAVLLLIIGLVLGLFGWLWHFQMPVIKMIFTSSMVCVAAGYCFILLAIFYFVIDVIRFRFGITFFTIIGNNAIVAYVLHERFGRALHPFVKEVLGGTSYWLGNYYGAMIQLGEFAIIFFLLYGLYRQKVFIKV